MGSWVETSSTPFRARITLQPWRWACDLPSPRPNIICHHSEDLNSLIGHSQTHQHRIRDRRHFGSTPTPQCWSEKKSKWLATTAPCSKWRTISPFITTPSVTKTSYWKCIHDTFYVPCRAPVILSVPLNSSGKRGKKMVEVYLLYFLTIALWCKMCRKCLRFCHLKHWRVCICIVSLESLCLVILLIAMHTVSQKSVDTGLRFCLLLCGHHFWIMYYSSQCPPLYLKGFVRGKDLKEQLLLWWPFPVWKCSDGSYNVKLILFNQFQSLIVDSDAILHSLLF